MNKTILCAALAGLLAAGAATTAQATEAKMMAGKEKCYGIAKAGKNDCASADGAHSCAGHATTDNSKHEFKLVATGECAKMGGATTAGK